MHRTLLILLLLLNLAACARSHYDNAQQHTFTPECFFGNSRIAMRDLTVPSSATRHYSKLKKIKIYDTQKVMKSGTQTSSSFISIKESYGPSINDKFNGVTHPYVTNLAMQSNAIVQKPKQNNVVSTSNSVDHTVSNSIQVKNNAEQGTSYIPLTFPVPPPKEMMRQFHMQVGEANMSAS